MQFHNRKKDNPDMVEPYSKGAYGKIYRIAYFIANYMAGEKDKKPEKEPKENKKNQKSSANRMLRRVPKPPATALASGEPRPTMRWETIEPHTCWKKNDSDWRTMVLNINNFPSEIDGLDKAKYDLVKKTIADSEVDILGIIELGRNEYNIPYCHGHLT